MSRHELQQRFDCAADTFERVDFVHAHTRDGLLARLDPMTIEARTIVDLGAATGASSRALTKKFRRARVVSLDLSLAMLRKASKRAWWFAKNPAVQADPARLPFADQSLDLVFSNLLLPWIDDRGAVFAEIARVLRKEGLLLFSTLGPDSLAGLEHEPFADMHDVGDDLVRAGLRDPVLDVDRLTINYESRESLADDLGALGAGDCLPDVVESLEFELELVYGHAWGGGPRRDPAEFRIDPGSIRKRGS